MEEYQTMIKDLVDVSVVLLHAILQLTVPQTTAAILVNVQNVFPAGYIEAFVANKDRTGQFSIGDDSVLGTSSVQVNISAAGLPAGGTLCHPIFCMNYAQIRLR